MKDFKKNELSHKIENLIDKIRPIQDRICFGVGNANDTALVELYKEKFSCDVEARTILTDIQVKLSMIKGRLIYGIKKEDKEYIEFIEMLVN